MSAIVHLPTVGDVERPRTRGECSNVTRPCRWTECRYHLGGERRRGTGEPSESCSLDVADRDGATLEIVGEILGFTRERIRQIEAQALRTFARRMRVLEGADDPDHRPASDLDGTRRTTP